MNPYSIYNKIENKATKPKIQMNYSGFRGKKQGTNKNVRVILYFSLTNKRGKTIIEVCVKKK